jgi:hypothetical protein
VGEADDLGGGQRAVGGGGVGVEVNGRHEPRMGTNEHE